MKAKIELECKDPELIIKALKPDMDKSERFKIKLEVEDKKLKLKVYSDDISGLLAGINSCMRLIKSANAVLEG